MSFELGRIFFESGTNEQAVFPKVFSALAAQSDEREAAAALAEREADRWPEDTTEYDVAMRIASAIRAGAR